MLIVTTKNNQILFQLTSNVIFTNVNNEWIRHQSLIASSINYYVIDWWWRHWWAMTSSFIFNRNACARFRPVESEWKYKVEYFRATLNLIFDPKIFSKSVIFDFKMRIFYIFDIFRRKSIYENFKNSIFSKIWKFRWCVLMLRMMCLKNPSD